MNRPFAVFDIDGTLIRWQLYHAVVEAIARPLPDTLASIKAARRQWKTRLGKNSFKDYEAELIKIFESLLAELTPEEFSAAVTTAFEEYKDQTYTYTRNLITELRRKDYLLFAISGSHTEIVGRLAKYYGFDDFMGTEYEQAGGRFTGKVKVAAFHKDRALQKLTNRNRVTFTGSLGVGDSASDAAFLEKVDRPIAFNPDQELFNIAQQKGWQIVIERKNVVYELKGNSAGKYLLQ